MSVYTTITIHNAPTLTAEKLDEALERTGFESSYNDTTYYPTEEHSWTLHGTSIYTGDEGDALAEDLSARHPGSRVEVREEWDSRDADNAGQAVRLYIAGEHVTAADRTEGLVPADLDASLAALRAALAGCGDLARAAAWLADGLDGSRAVPPADPVTVVSVNVVDEWGTDLSEGFAACFDYSTIIAGKKRALSVEESRAGQLRTRESVDGIIKEWVASAESHTPNRYGVEWFESAGAYVIGCWTGARIELSAIYSESDRGEVAFDALVDALSLSVSTTWSDGVTS